MIHRWILNLRVCCFSSTEVCLGWWSNSIQSRIVRRDVCCRGALSMFSSLPFLVMLLLLWLRLFVRSVLCMIRLVSIFYGWSCDAMCVFVWFGCSRRLLVFADHVLLIQCRYRLLLLWYLKSQLSLHNSLCPSGFLFFICFNDHNSLLFSAWILLGAWDGWIRGMSRPASFGQKKKISVAFVFVTLHVRFM